MDSLLYYILLKKKISAWWKHLFLWVQGLWSVFNGRNFAHCSISTSRINAYYVIMTQMSDVHPKFHPEQLKFSVLQRFFGKTLKFQISNNMSCCSCSIKAILQGFRCSGLICVFGNMPTTNRFAVSNQDSKRGHWVQLEVSCTSVKRFHSEWGWSSMTPFAL